MSLAGMQGKFTLTRVGDAWYWPTYEVPSTHILKPPSEKLRRIETFETLGLELARSIGVRSSTSEATSFLGQSTFIVDRWDRAEGVRLPAEDLNQSLGYPTDYKYDVGAPEVARLLDQHGMAREFVRQLAFNAAIGNADAHAKNYSVLLVGGRVQLAPLYDAVPVLLYPQFDQKLAMPIGKARLPGDLTERNWRLFALESNLDPDIVCQDAFTVMSEVADRYYGAFLDGGADQARLSMISKHVKKMKRAIPIDFRNQGLAPIPRILAMDLTEPKTGDVYVAPHVRGNGTPVEGYWRNRRSQ